MANPHADIEESIRAVPIDASATEWAKACIDDLSLHHDVDLADLVVWFDAAMAASAGEPFVFTRDLPQDSNHSR